MRKNYAKKLGLTAATILMSAVWTGCTDYWWSRGQPPGVNQLLEKSEARLNESLSTHSSSRPVLSPLASKVSIELKKSLSSLDNLEKPAGASSQQSKLAVANMTTLKQSFMELEGTLSIGSRAAYSELSGQLRGFARSVESGQAVDPKAFGLFAARTTFFLASELKVPAPNFGLGISG